MYLKWPEEQHIQIDSMHKLCKVLNCIELCLLKYVFAHTVYALLATAHT